MMLTLQECLKFLKGIHYGGSQDFSSKSFYPSNAFSNIYLDTASTFLKVIWKKIQFFHLLTHSSMWGFECYIMLMSNGIVWLT